MNHTQQYSLSLWDPDDRVQRTDFNDNNAKIDAALAALEERAARLERAAAALNWLAGYQIMQEMVPARKREFGCGAFGFNEFAAAATSSGLHCEVQTSGTGTITCRAGNSGCGLAGFPIPVAQKNWDQMWVWVQYSGNGIIQLSVNAWDTAKYSPAYTMPITAADGTENCAAALFKIPMEPTDEVTIWCHLDASNETSDIVVYGYHFMVC